MRLPIEGAVRFRVAAPWGKGMIAIILRQSIPVRTNFPDHTRPSKSGPSPATMCARQLIPENDVRDRENGDSSEDRRHWFGRPGRDG